MSHAIRLASLVAACVILLATAAAADPADLDYQLQPRLNPLLEAKLNRLLEAKLEAQAANLLARNQRPATGEEILSTSGGSASPRRRAASEAPATAVDLPDRVTSAQLALGGSVPTADSADLTTGMTCAVSDSGTLGCVAHPVCADPEIELASAPLPISLARC